MKKHRYYFCVALNCSLHFERSAIYTDKRACMRAARRYVQLSHFQSRGNVSKFYIVTDFDDSFVELPLYVLRDSNINFFKSTIVL